MTCTKLIPSNLSASWRTIWTKESLLGRSVYLSRTWSSLQRDLKLKGNKPDSTERNSTLEALTSKVLAARGIAGDKAI